MSSDPETRDAINAVLFAEKAVAKANREDPVILEPLAAASIEAGQFTRAVETQKEARTRSKTDKGK